MEPPSPSSSSSSSSVSSIPGPLTVFYDSLTKGINELETMLQTDKNKFMSIQFLEKVLSLIRFCQNQMTHCAMTLNLPTSGSWYDEYMAENEKIMTSIKDIKDCVKRMADYNDECTVLTTFIHANRVLNQQACQQMITFITNCITAAEALEADNIPLSTNRSDLRHIEIVGYETILHENSGLNGVIYASRHVCRTLLRNFLYGLVYCWEDYEFEKYVYEDGVHFDSSFMVSTDKLKQRVESEIRKITRRTGILWYEFRILKVVLDELKREFERVSEGGGIVNLESEGSINETVKSLTQCVEVLKEGTEKIIEQINDITAEMTKARFSIFGLGLKLNKY